MAQPLDVVGVVEIMLLDSQNKEVIGMDWESLQSTAAKMPYKSWVEAGWKHETMVRLQIDSFEGTQSVIQLVQKRVMEKESVHSCLLRLNLGGFLASYYDYLGVTEQEISRMGASQWLSACVGWCENHFPPAMIESNIIATLQELKANPSFQSDVAIMAPRLLMWLQTVRQKLGEAAATQCQLPPETGHVNFQFVKRLECTVRQMEDVLDVNAAAPLASQLH